jgi:heterodisulfide reductase subunit A
MAETTEEKTSEVKIPDATELEPRIGVFVCHCGKNIGGYLEMSELCEHAAGLPHVVFVQENMYTCSETGLKQIQEAIREHDLNRVVVAACTPRTHEPLFREVCQDAGLNPYLFEFANIRDQCSWVHTKEKGKATEKAKDLISMSVARAALLKFQEHVRVNVKSIALVIGGGPAGMTASLSLARRGFKVKLVEKEEKLGGMLNKLHILYPSNIDSQELLKRMVESVTAQRNIEIYTSAELISLSGFVGDYQVRIRHDGEEKELGVGVIVVATGADVLKPEGMYGYDGEKVITQLDLEDRLKKGDMKADTVVMLQCVGARQEEREYCSRICCTTAIKNAMTIKEMSPETDVYILYQDVQTYGAVFEEHYAQAREMGVIFVKYLPDKEPEFGDGFVKVYDDMLGENLGIKYDLLVLSTPLIPRSDSVELSKMLRVPIDKYGFFLEAHIKLAPVEFSSTGIFLAGSAHWPSHIGESVTQAEGAAMRASTHLSRGYVEEEPLYASIDEKKCIGCRLCEYVCAYGAPRVFETEEGLKARIKEVLCKGCGLCGATCPEHAVTMNHYTDDQIEAQLKAALGVSS